MRIIDKTPFQNDKGEIDIISRAQATLKYGPSWYPELQAQKVVIAQLDRLLEKGYALIRNFNLPGSEVVVPMILLAPSGIFMIYVTHLKGFYEAKGDQWNKVDQGRSLAAPRNLLTIARRLADATERYFELQKIKAPFKIEPVLIAADPGLNIESMRPLIRVVKSDAINQFAGTLIQNRLVMRNEQVYELAERIVTPRIEEPPAPAPAAPPQPASRARAIFNAAETSPAVNDPNLAFAFDEDDQNISAQELPPGQNESAPLRALPEAPKRKLYLGMTPVQLAILGGILLVWVCVLAVFVVYILYASNAPLS
jgi:hypothetical protein